MLKDTGKAQRPNPARNNGPDLYVLPYYVHISLSYFLFLKKTGVDIYVCIYYNKHSNIPHE